MKPVAARLKEWEREKFGYVRRKIRNLREGLDMLQRRYPLVEVLQQREDVEREFDKVLEREEVLWCQRSRVNWLKCGDRNTKFFHSFAKQSGAMNKIAGVLGEDNIWRTGYVNVGCVFVDYFRQLFSTRGSDMSHEIFGEVAGRVTVEQGVSLNRPFSREEIEVALKDMGPTKSSGPDGMSPLFYQKLKAILPGLIADYQSAFVPRRLIHDNVIAVFETVHNLKRRGKKSRQKAVVKLDMAKDYDRVE
ncbi:hypothetical protein ACLB2K_013850 [Fragaria x ananassa]